MIVFETERLYLRKLDQADLTDLSIMLQDIDVMRAYEHPFTEKEIVEWLAKQLYRYDKYGFGLWAAILKDSGEFVGQIGLTVQKCCQEDILEIGYLLKKDFWHNGYATEAAFGCKKYAYDVLHADKVFSMIKYNNFSSQKVAGRLGMKKIKEFNIHYYNKDMLHYLYGVSLP